MRRGPCGREYVALRCYGFVATWIAIVLRMQAITVIPMTIDGTQTLRRDRSDSQTSATALTIAPPTATQN